MPLAEQKHLAFTNERGNAVKTFAAPDSGNCHRFDFNLYAPGTGWQQYDTYQDAAYFLRIWVNIKQRKIAAYAEGAFTLITAPDGEHFKAELAVMEEFYGPGPPALQIADKEGILTCTGDEPFYAAPEPKA